MNRFAALVAQLETLADDGMRQAYIADYLEDTQEPDRALARQALLGQLKIRPIKTALLKGLAAERIDPKLFELAEVYVGDIGETIALTWTPKRRANRDPSLAEIVEALSTLGKSELPKRIEAWLDACDETGRWALIKLITGMLRTERAKANETSPDEQPQQELFRKPARKSTAGSIRAILLYAERTNARARTSPLRCTVGVWNGDTLSPVGHFDVPVGEQAEAIERYIAAHTIARFGPVREVRRDREQALVLDVAFADIAVTIKRKSGIALRAPKLIKIDSETPPANAATLAQLIALTTGA